MAAGQLRQALTDFATELAGLTTVIEVEEPGGGIAVSATTGGRQGISTASSNRRQRLPMLALVLSTQLLPVQGRDSRRRRGGLSRRGLGIDVEIAIVRMLLAEVVARLRFGLTSGENLLQLLDKLLQILAGKFPTEPKYQSWYAAHGGESLGNLAGSLMVVLERETSPPFLLAVNSQHGSSGLNAQSPLDSQKDPSSPRPQGGESRNASFSHEFNRIWA